jgi:hypothetical protein
MEQLGEHLDLLCALTRCHQADIEAQRLLWMDTTDPTGSCSFKVGAYVFNFNFKIALQHTGQLPVIK